MLRCAAQQTLEDEEAGTGWRRQSFTVNPGLTVNAGRGPGERCCSLSKDVFSFEVLNILGRKMLGRGRLRVMDAAGSTIILRAVIITAAEKTRVKTKH